MTNHRLRRHLLLLLFASVISLAGTGRVAAVTYELTFDTTSLAGTSGWLAFNLVSGSEPFQNVVAIKQFASTSELGSTTTDGDVAGTLIESSLVLTASTFFTEYRQQVDFEPGTTTFQFEIDPIFSDGAIPDSLSFFVLNNALIPYPTSDPTGAHALLVVDLVVPAEPVLFSSNLSGGVVPKPPCTCIGDADKNAFINFSDYGAVRGTFGLPASAATGEGDADCNGFVNFSDYAAVRAAFGQACE